VNVIGKRSFERVSVVFFISSGVLQNTENLKQKGLKIVLERENARDAKTQHDSCDVQQVVETLAFYLLVWTSLKFSGFVFRIPVLTLTAHLIFIRNRIINCSEKECERLLLSVLSTKRAPEILKTATESLSVRIVQLMQHGRQRAPFKSPMQPNRCGRCSPAMLAGGNHMSYKKSANMRQLSKQTWSVGRRR
jgi:hypothetical protein